MWLGTRVFLSGVWQLRNEKEVGLISTAAHLWDLRGDRLCSTSSFIELQIPPDTGNGSWNAGIPLARVFWHLPSGALMALIQVNICLSTAVVLYAALPYLKTVM